MNEAKIITITQKVTHLSGNSPYAYLRCSNLSVDESSALRTRGVSEKYGTWGTVSTLRSKTQTVDVSPKAASVN